MKLKPLILIPAAVSALVLAGCSSDDSVTADKAATQSDDSTAAESTTSCPTTVPASTTQADWVLQGSSGSLEVVAPTPESAPLITVNGDFEVAETTVKTLTPGTGDEVTTASTVVVCYQGVTGSNGETFDNAYERGAPASFPATGVVSGFAQALVGQKVGAKVAVAMTPADGYGPGGNPDAGIKGTDTLVFALSILEAY